MSLPRCRIAKKPVLVTDETLCAYELDDLEATGGKHDISSNYLSPAVADKRFATTAALGPQFDRSEKAEKAVEHAVAAGTDPF